MTDEKLPWESKTELIAFVGVVAGLVASFGFCELSTEQIGAIGSILFVVVMILRTYGGGKIVMVK